ncbi:PSD1 and planctomycete cytochrome C domain-containing protein [Acidicapsa acidisoli]|uniref:PSD1 and planctomycete cytochrome C domain-containing protein n=1 Tax=Acidicapsa acidisoli TaxID=1615681 RepID=UPI0021DF8481|nr:PSD1 and planctomycete cytochrome C domain-containing protein [Acidicapsa acidisoli]
MRLAINSGRTPILFATTAVLITASVTVSVTDPVRAQQAASPAPGTPEFFTQRVEPILDDNCYSCHQESQSGGLRLDSYGAILKGGGRGPAIIPGDPETSILINAIRRTGKLKMPPKHSLEQSEINTLVEWVKAGAKGTSASTDTVAKADSAPMTPVVAPVAQSQPAVVNTSVTISAPHPQGALSDADFFENNIRPILANNCLSCHGDATSGGLKLDSREALLKGGGRGPAIVPGDPDKSLIITAVHQTTALKMPKGGKLTPQEVADLTEWVKHGAVWPKSAPGTVFSASVKTGIITDKQRAFWSFQPLKPVPVPESKNAKWARTPIDKFVLAKMLDAGIKPSAQADRRTLIRRATYDLTGLPPTPEEVEAFENDKSPKAWENLVDRLLASPKYGERWGRHWLDVARYAEDDVRGLDPKGRGYMPFNGAYRYRDWVIKSFNQDMPFDEFLRLQIAGDKIPAKTKQDQEDYLTATSFLGAGPWVWDQAEPIQGRADERNERVDAVTRGTLGLTVACARCHNHKYDPITQKDYYAMIGIFANSTYKEYSTVSESQAAAYESNLAKLEKLQIDYQEYTRTETRQFADALANQSASYMVAAWNVLGKPKATVEEAASKAKLDSEVLRRWVDYLTPGKQVQYDYLKDWQAMLAADGGTEDEAKALAESFQRLVLRVRQHDREVEEQNEIVRDKNDVPRHRVHDAKPSEFETDDQFCPGCALELKTIPIDEAKLYSDLFVTRSGDQETKFVPGILVFTGWDLASRLGPIRQAYIEAQQKEIADLKKKVGPENYPYVHGMADKPLIQDVKLNVRGNPHSLGDTVPRRFLTVLAARDTKPYSNGSGRLELANDIASSPLAMRVIVNRIWKWHFGSGIVNTPDNFGYVGEEPTDPELLEFLAHEFVANGRSIKKLQREIMLSAVYQTSVAESAEAHEKDGANRLYSHFNRQRLDAEEIRDTMLFVSGDLDTKKTSGPSSDFSEDNSEPTVFCKVSRYRLNNYLQIFDFPNPNFTSEQRFSSNVPLQQLYFMNNLFVYKQAGILAERVHSEATDKDRIVKLYQFVFQRKPSDEELELGLKFLSTTPERAGYAVAGEPITAWRQYARIMLSSNEFQFLD